MPFVSFVVASFFVCFVAKRSAIDCRRFFERTGCLLSCRALGCVALLLVCAFALPALAQGQSAPPSPPLDHLVTDDGQFQAHVFASFSATGNFNSPPSKVNTLRVFDFKSNQAVVDMVEGTLVRSAAHPNAFGFRIDAVAGQTVPHVAAAAGLFRDSDTGETHGVDIPQAFVSWMAPIGSGLRLDGGKFVSPFGVESIESFDHRTDNASRSILFGYAMPMTLTGGQISYTFSPAIAVKAVVATGWDRFTDNNGAPTVGGQATFGLHSRVSVSIGVLSGPEQADNTHDVRTSFDAVLRWKVSETTRVALNVDEGREEHASPAGGRGDWHGYAGYLHHAFSPHLAVSLRGELFHDVSGARTGISQQLGEFTLTPEWRARKALTIRGDYRVDHSDMPVFDSSSGPRHIQQTVSVNAVIVF